MGNHLSCVSASSSSYDHADAAPCTTPSVKNPVMSKVLQPESGLVLELYEPTSAAELMLEYGPGHVVCDFTSHVAALSSYHHHNHAANGDDDDHGHHQTRDQFQQLQHQYLHARLSPLSADHQLALGHCYLLIPIARLSSRLSFHDLAAYAHALFPSLSSSSSPLKHTHIYATAPKLPAKPSTSLSRVAPLSSPIIFTRSPSLNIDPSCQYHSFSIAPPTPSSSVALQLQQGMICRTKSWSPKLETITEMPTVF